MENNFDVVVVGGSIAGSTAATLYARQGLRVALVEARSNPDAYKALCTHFIQPCATPTIQRLGVDEDIERAGGLRNSLEVWNRWGWIRWPESEGAAPFGYSISRSKLDPILRSTAATTPGVEFMPGRTATELVKDGYRITGVKVRDENGQETTISARLVVAADGRHSKIAELAGVGKRKMPNNRSGYFAYFEGISMPEDAARTWFLDPDIAYVFPNEDGTSVLACMFDRKDKLDWFKKDMAGNLRRTFEKLPDGPDMKNAVQISKMIGAVDLPNSWRKRPPAGLVFVGDSMVAADPLFGVGCGWAFQSAEWLVDATAAHLKGPELEDAVRSYRGQVRKHILGHYLMSSEYSRSRRYNPAEKLLFSAAAKDPKTARVIQEFGARTIPVGKLVSPVTMGRAISVNLRHRSSPEMLRKNRALADAATETSGAGDRVRHANIEVAGINSPYIEAGTTGSREAVVFVHGNPGSSLDFTELVAEAGLMTRAVAVDMPGFGQAGKPAEFDYTVEGYAAHLGKLLAQMGIERVHLVLHDFGGPWGLAWAAANPEACASVTLLNTGVLLDYDWHYLAKIWQTPVVGEAFMAGSTGPGFRLLLRHGNKGGLPRRFLDQMYADFDTGTKRAVVKLYRASKDPDAAFRQLSAALKALDLPALVVFGARDPYIPVEQAEIQKKTFPSARVVILDESGHWPFIDDPDAVKQELMPFLAGELRFNDQLSNA